jgi:hypothetical protein
LFPIESRGGRSGVSRSNVEREATKAELVEGPASVEQLGEACQPALLADTLECGNGKPREISCLLAFSRLLF